MTKSDLKSGMIVETREGDRYVVIDTPHGTILSGNGKWARLKYYTEDLIRAHDNELDIMKVFNIKSDQHGYCFFTPRLKEKDERSLVYLWGREQAMSFNDAIAKSKTGKIYHVSTSMPLLPSEAIHLLKANNFDITSEIQKDVWKTDIK